MQQNSMDNFVPQKPEGLVSFLAPEMIVSQINIPPGISVADFGSGAGHIAVLVAQKIGPDGKLNAVDILEDKLDSVMAKAKAVGLENVTAIRANLEVLGSSKLQNDSQDLALLINILSQSSKKENILRETNRVLKKGAELLIVDWKKGVGGLGTPDNLRTDKEEMKSLVGKESFVFEKEINTGQFHYGLIFKK